MLRISYQLKDSAGRAQVDTTRLVIKPLLSYAADATPPTGAHAAGNALQDCDISSLSAASGIGQCNVAVDQKYFPAAAGMSATVTLRVLVG